MTQSQTPPTLGIKRKIRCIRPVIPGDNTITDSTCPSHRGKEQMHKTSHTRRWHNHRLHQPLALRERADAQDQSYQEMTQSQTPPTLGIERKSRCTRPIIPGDDTITDSSYPWHWQKEQMHKTSHTRRWHNHRLHLSFALRERADGHEMTQSQTPPILGTDRKSRCKRPIIPGDDTITDSTYPWHREKEQMHKTSHTRRWHNHRLHLPLAYRERADAQDQSYQETTQSQTPPTLGKERKNRCTRPVTPKDDTITDSTYPWHREKEQMHKTNNTRRWHNHRLHLPLA